MSSQATSQVGQGEKSSPLEKFGKLLWAEEKAWKEVAFREFFWVLLLFMKKNFLPPCLIFTKVLFK